MRTIEFNKGVKELKNYKCETVYFPYMIIDGEDVFFYEQGNVVFYDNREDAEEYIED